MLGLEGAFESLELNAYSGGVGAHGGGESEAAKGPKQVEERDASVATWARGGSKNSRQGVRSSLIVFGLVGQAVVSGLNALLCTSSLLFLSLSADTQSRRSTNALCAGAFTN